MFGDDDPEDAWDDGDPRPDKIGLLVRVLLSVALERADPGHDHPRVVARIAFGIWQTTRLQERQTRSEAPPLEALAATFALLNALSRGP
jgi:hypothetical protein